MGPPARSRLRSPRPRFLVAAVTYLFLGLSCSQHSWQANVNVAALGGGATSQRSQAGLIQWLREPLVSGWEFSPVRWQLVNAAFMALNLKAVSLPGRLDSTPQQSSGVQSLLRPAGWAFAIWALIYLGETAWFFLGQFRFGAHADEFLLASASPWWAAACACQGLWCLTFRPWWRNSGLLWVPALCLAGATYCLGRTDELLRMSSLPGWAGCVGRLPLTVHFGWLCAASLVTFNQYGASSACATPSTSLALALASEAAATALGCTLALGRQSPALALVAAWALTAVAQRMRKAVAALEEREAPARWDPMGSAGLNLDMFIKMLGDHLLTGSYEATTKELLQGKTAIGFYFSAHWCPPCKLFTPKLADAYRNHLKAKGLEVVYISLDKDEPSFASYFEEMPWLALPFNDAARRESLAKTLKVQGIPTLVLFQPDGTVITTQGRGLIESDPTGSMFPWTAAAVGAEIIEGATTRDLTLVQMCGRVGAAGCIIVASWVWAFGR